MSGFNYPISTSPEISLSPEQEFGLSKTEQTTQEQKPEPAPITSPSPNFFDEVTQMPAAGPTEDTFGFGLSAPSVETTETFETSPFSEFNFPQPEPLISQTTPTTEPPTGFEFSPPTSDINFSMPSTILPGEESFEDFVSQRTKELSGENTISMEEYLSNKTSTIPQEITLPATDSKPQEFTLPVTSSNPTNVEDKIEELANKLKSAGKITPVINFAQKETPAVSEQDTPVGMGFVTPTLAEIYAKQGWFDDAIKEYRTLAHNKPAEKERYEKRIAELEELKKKNEG